MPLTLQTAGIGTNFDGTANQGLVPFSGLSNANDTERAEIFNVGVQNPTDEKTSIWGRLAPDLASATVGPFLELFNVANATGVTMACCHCIVPRGWSLFVVSTGPTTAATQLAVDWRRVTLETRV